MVRHFLVACIVAIVVGGAAPFSLTTLLAFRTSSGGGPVNDNEVPIGGYLYSTTNGGGSHGNGTVYRLNLATGVQQVLYEFSGGNDGCFPSGMTLHRHVLYGTTISCGSAGYGTVFSVDVATGTEHTLYGFQNGADGSYPQGNLVGLGGVLWGTADYGGANGAGTIFKIDPDSDIVTPVYSFGAGSDAAFPPNGLIADGGTLYGVTQYGGANNTGTVYAYDSVAGAERVLYSFGAFGGTDGYRPASRLFQRDGYLYGVAQAGGIRNLGVIFRVNQHSGSEDVLHNFRGRVDGAIPYTGLVAMRPGDGSGIVYGITSVGGARDRGTIFSFDLASNRLVRLYSFSGGDDGALPYSQLSAAGGVFYGNTATGGAHHRGTVFSFTP